MMEAGFKKLAGDIISTAPIDPNLPAPPVVKEAPQADFLEMDLHLARIDGQMRSSWIVEPADGRLPFTDAGKQGRAATAKARRATTARRAGRCPGALPDRHRLARGARR